MALLRAAAPAFALSCLTMLVVTACGSSTRAGPAGEANGSNAGSSGAAGSLNLGGSSLGSGADGSTGDGATNGIDACAGDLIQAERIPLDMYILLDISGSMTQPTVGDPNVTKWQAVSSALVDFVNDPSSADLGIGLQLFPLRNPTAPTSCKTDADCTNFGYCFTKACWNLADQGLLPCDSDEVCGASNACIEFGSCTEDATFACPNVGGVCKDPTGKTHGDCVAVPSSTCVITDDCRTATYAAPAAEIATLPAGQANLVKAIQGTMPEEGLTPTGPALTGAVEHASTWAKAHPDHQVVAVLATDGVPTLKASGQYCSYVTDPADIDAVVNVAAAGRRGTPTISTFVIGVQSPDDVALGAPDILNAIAMAGGSDKAFIVNTMGDVQADFRSALDAIRQAGLSCDLAIPKPAAGKTLDYGLVNVRFDDGKGAVTLGNVASEADCGKGKNWYYDVDPKTAAPSRILTCPAACDAFKNTDMGSVKIVLGCQTNIVK